MTIRRPIIIDCDWPGCTAKIDRGDTRVTAARTTAKAEGWKAIRGLLHLCGPADKSPHWVSKLAFPHGHADAGHIPVLAAAGRNYFRVSCSCGWTDPNPAPATPFLTRYRWIDHLI